MLLAAIPPRFSFSSPYQRQRPLALTLPSVHFSCFSCRFLCILFYLLFAIRRYRVCAFMFVQDDVVRCLRQWIVKAMGGKERGSRAGFRRAHLPDLYQSRDPNAISNYDGAYLMVYNQEIIYVNLK